MFETKQISKLNSNEIAAFNFLVKHQTEVQDMTIRDFAQKTYTSPSAIMRLSNKLGFSGWSELKYHLKSSNNRTAEEHHYDNMLAFNLFLHTLSSKAFQSALSKAAELIAHSNYTLTLGVGTSGSLSDYAAKYLINTGLQSFSITDPYIGISIKDGTEVVSLVLSESGETEQVLNKVVELREAGSKIISICNSQKNTLSRIADVSLYYNLADKWSERYPLGNLTTQLPTLAILESLAHKAIAMKEKTKN